MAPPVKVKATVDAAAVAPKPAAARAIKADDIIYACDLVTEHPMDMAGWKRLIQLSLQPGTVRVERDGKAKTMSVQDGVVSEFFLSFAQLPHEKRIEVLKGLVQSIGPKAYEVQRQILITAAVKEPQDVRAGLLDAVRSIPDAEIHAGRRDQELIRDFYGAVIHTREAACAEKGASPFCGETLSPLYWERQKHSSRLAMGLSFEANAFRSFAGEGVEQVPFGVGATLDYVGPEFNRGFRPIYGGHLRWGPGIMGLSGRLGIASEQSKASALNFTLDGGLFRIKGDENRRDDIPLEFVGDGLTPDGYDFSMRKTTVDRIVTGANLGLGLEFDRALYQKWMKGGDLFGIHLVLGLGAGVFAGGVSDDRSVLSYEPGTDGVSVMPNDNDVIVSKPENLSARNRSGSLTMGTKLEGAIGLRGKF